MKKTLILLAAAAMLTSCKFIAFNGDPSDRHLVFKGGPEVVDTLDLKDFNAIRVNGQGDIEFIQSDTYKVILTSNEGVLEQLDCRVEDGTLVLSRKEHVQLVADKYEFTIYAPVLTALTVNGAADMDLSSYKSHEPLTISVNGAADLELENVQVPALSVSVRGAGDLELKDMDVDRLSVEVRGASDVVLSGRAREVSLSISGAGDIDARNLEADVWKTEKNGMGKVRR